MIKKIILFALLINLVNTIATAQSKKFTGIKFDTPEQKSELYLLIAKKYNTNALAILNSKNYKYYTKWADGTGHYQTLSSYGTIIHETCHSVNNDLSGFSGYGYFISSDIKIIVSKTKIFKSNEINKIIPKNIQNKIFRYKTYISGTEQETEIASIKNGIYGLLDEFDAYYQGTRAVVELFDYYNTFAGYSNPYYWALYISNCYSIIYAYYEFRLFIAWYMSYAKSTYPIIYNSIMTNRNFRAVYTLIDKEYEKAVEQYFINRQIIMDRINKNGSKKASISGKFLLIKDKKKTYGYGVPDTEIEYLKSLFKEQDYQILNKLTINTINGKNYQDFLD